MKRCLCGSRLFLILGIALVSFSASGASPDQGPAHGHTAPHNGVLNEITACGVGHAETLITGEILDLWLLDGGSETGRSIQVPDESIPLSIISENRRLETVLQAEPMLLAGEKKGKCSHFRATVPGLAGLKTFEGYGWIRFKGTMHPLRLSWPKGFEASAYGPDQEAEPKREDGQTHNDGPRHDNVHEDAKGTDDGSDRSRK